MAIEQQRWTIEKVLSGLDWRWTYRLSGQSRSISNFRSPKEASKAAEREWKRK